ncbi:MAG: hypothetical protein WC959_02940 [Kiritimatiellales bacterium]
MQVKTAGLFFPGILGVFVFGLIIKEVPAMAVVPDCWSTRLRINC